MPDLRLRSRSGLEQALAQSASNSGQGAGLTLSLVPDTAITSLIVRKGNLEGLRERVGNDFGVDLPIDPRWVGASDFQLVWSGPGQWLATKEGAAHGLERELRKLFHGLAAICDQSDARILIDVAGPRVREVLMKGAIIDLHPRAFAPGDVAVTAIGHIGIHIWQTDAAPSYRVAVLRSLAPELWRWLVTAGVEYGVRISRA